MTAGDDQDGGAGDSPKAHYGKVDDPRLSAEEMDMRRKENLAYEYLCHLEEAKVWIEACVGETLPPTTELEEGLRNGVALAKLAHFVNPELVPAKKIYDKDQSRYQARGLHFRHTDNINHWLKCMADVGLPKIFYPETTDIYDRKNMPRVIYCIHALSLYLFKLGKAPQIQDLYGKIKFTDEEISAMRKELEKYGIQMPAFSKIGGILANEMPVDEAALHAAVIMINDAIDKQQAAETVSALQNPAAHLVKIELDLATGYQHMLYDAKYTKAEIARNKSLDPDSSYVPDVYDELLTQAEIQGNINKVNTMFAVSHVHEAIVKRDGAMLLTALRMPQLSMRDIRDGAVDFYLNNLGRAQENKRNNNEDEEDAQMLSREELQMLVAAANLDAMACNQKLDAIQAINEALERSDPAMLVKALQNPHAELPPTVTQAGQLYHTELSCMRGEKQANLDHEELVAGVQVLSAIAQINQAMDAGSTDIVYSSLTNEDAHLSSIEQGCVDKYCHALASAKVIKQQNSCEFLTHFEIQQCIVDVNQQMVDENQRILAITTINDAIERGDVQDTLEALQLPSACLVNVKVKEAAHYQQLLSQHKQHKAQENHDPTAVLWYEEIQNVINLANTDAEEGLKLSVGVAAINIATDTEDPQNLLKCLQNVDVLLHSVTPQCATTYVNKLLQYKVNKVTKAKKGENGGGWMMNRLKDGYKFYFNGNDMDYAWERPDGVKKDHSLLTREEIQTCVCEVTAAHDRQLLFQSNQQFIVRAQAHIRGYLARKQLLERRTFIQHQLPAVTKVQSWWRMILQRRWYRWRQQYIQTHKEAVVTLQSAVRMFLARRKYEARMKHLRQNEWAVIKIQAFMRSNLAKHDYKTLMYGANPSLGVVRKFVHLLDVGDLDYAEEIELERLRQQVVTDIRTNNRLEDDLNSMDIKIGLLVKNRITLQDVISQHKTLKRYRDSTSTLARGLKALSKQSRGRLEAYQHLFYLLQTQPVYLARLIFALPQSRTTKFMESVILTLYNYASNQREEYLLLRLFQTALCEEIRSKVDKMGDIVAGNPLVVKMIVSFNRNARGQGALRELLNPLVRGVIEDRNLQINTNPVEVYKQWVNQMETHTGKASGLPYDVSIEQALEHDEVKERIGQSVQCLQQATERFLSVILSSVDLISYGMRYMAKVMRDALRSRFPEAAEKDILKIIGNLIYYRYINSAIAAPDAFDIIDVGANKGLTNDQRRNLGSIAKILQFAASNKGFGGDSGHLACLNKYIMDAHNRFKQYFRAICEVPDPENQFNMDQYTDVTRVTKPVIYISIAEIIDTHKLLLEHQDTIAPDLADPLHELLDDLADVPDVEQLIGDSGGADEAGTSRTQLGKTEMSLTLSSKFEVKDHEHADLKSLLIRTKRMVVDVIRCQQGGETLSYVLNTPATDSEEKEHQVLVMKRERVDQKALSKKAPLARQQSMVGDTRLPVESMKVKIRSHLKELEQAGQVSHRDHYQTVINSIVQDVRNQRLYRQQRKQNMKKLGVTQRSLQAKRAFFEEQIDYYNQYVKTCLDNLATKGKKSGRRLLKDPTHASKVKGSIKYSAAKLHEKGIILEIEELPTNQFKNVLFEFSATGSPGVFDLSAKFMGVSMEKVELVFQNLLQLQYEGVAVMKMFDRARINVNLLIFLLNKKFYGK